MVLIYVENSQIIFGNLIILVFNTDKYRYAKGIT